MLSNKLTLKFLWFYPQEKLSLTHTAQECGWEEWVSCSTWPLVTSQQAGKHQGAMPSDRHKLLSHHCQDGRTGAWWVVFARLSLHVLCSPAEHISQSESATCPHVTAGRLETGGEDRAPRSPRVMRCEVFSVTTHRLWWSEGQILTSTFESGTA